MGCAYAAVWGSNRGRTEGVTWQDDRPAVGLHFRYREHNISPAYAGPRFQLSNGGRNSRFRYD